MATAGEPEGRKLRYLVLNDDDPSQWRVERRRVEDTLGPDFNTRPVNVTYSKRPTTTAEVGAKTSTEILWCFRQSQNAYEDQENKDTLMKVIWMKGDDVRWNTGVDFDHENDEYQKSCALYIAHSIAVSFAVHGPLPSTVAGQPPPSEAQPVLFATAASNKDYVTRLLQRVQSSTSQVDILQKSCQTQHIKRSIIKRYLTEVSKMLRLIDTKWEDTFKKLILQSRRSPPLKDHEVKRVSLSFANAGYLRLTSTGGVRSFLDSLGDSIGSPEKFENESRQMIAAQKALAQWDIYMNGACLFLHEDRIPIHMTLKLCTAESCVARGAAAPVPGDLAMELTTALNPETSRREVSEFIHAPLGTKLTYYAFQEDDESRPILQQYNLDCQVLLHWACNGVRMIHTEESMQCALTLFHILLPVTTAIMPRTEEWHFVTMTWASSFVLQLSQRVQDVLKTLRPASAPASALHKRFTDEIVPVLDELRSETNDDGVTKKVARVALKPDLAFEPLLITMLQNRLTLSIDVCKALLSYDYGVHLRQLHEASIDVHVQASHILLAKLKTLGLVLQGETLKTTGADVLSGNQKLIAAVHLSQVKLYRHTVTQVASMSGLALHREKTLVK